MQTYCDTRLQDQILPRKPRQDNGQREAVARCTMPDATDHAKCKVAQVIEYRASRSARQNKNTDLSFSDEINRSTFNADSISRHQCDLSRSENGIMNVSWQYKLQTGFRRRLTLHGLPSYLCPFAKDWMFAVDPTISLDKALVERNRQVNGTEAMIAKSDRLSIMSFLKNFRRRPSTSSQDSDKALSETQSSPKRAVCVNKMEVRLSNNKHVAIVLPGLLLAPAAKLVPNVMLRIPFDPTSKAERGILMTGQPRISYTLTQAYALDLRLDYS
ncbi:hypothetical protein LSAT2_007803 [Lamellibrachia satsuma]|nr:hypothetical protein LSAT2_007803 [Lamellibrachia satsuma]